MTDLLNTLETELGLDPETSRALKHRIEQVIRYVPRIGIFGKTGAGKSSLCNALFGAETCPVSDVEACTRQAQEVSLNAGNKRIVLVDVPGVGENRDRDDEYHQLYTRLMPELDAVLWVLKADDRAYSVDLQFYRQVVQPCLDKGKPFLVVLNQVDKMEPFREWDVEKRQPGARQADNIQRKISDVANNFAIPRSRITAVSAAEKFGLTDLAEVLLYELPPEKVVSTYSNLEKEAISSRVEARAESSFWAVVADVIGKVAAPVVNTARRVWDGVKSFFGWF